MSQTADLERIKKIINASTKKYIYFFSNEMIENLIDRVVQEVHSISFDEDKNKWEKKVRDIAIKMAQKLTIESLNNDKVVINQYFKKSWNKGASTEDNIRDLVIFLNEVAFEPTLDFYLALFESQKVFRNALENLFKKLPEKLTINDLETISFYNNISQVIDAYLNYKNIEVSYEEEEKDDFELDKSYDKDHYTDDPVKAYIREISKIPLLTPSEEKAFLERIAAGDEEAKNEFATHNLRLIVSIAKRKLGRGLELLDMTSEGYFGLKKAIDKFDITKGYKFSTYATWWIRQSIDRAIADLGSAIRKPVHIQETYNKLIRLQRQLTEEYGHEASLQEVADYLGWTLKKVQDVYMSHLDPVSMNVTVGDDEDTELEHFLASDIDDYEGVELRSLRTVLFKVMETTNRLTDRERNVLIYRFGLIDGRSRTLEEVGQIYNVTRERIRQIEAKALKKIGRNPQTRGLADFLDNPSKGIAYIEFKNSRYYENNTPKPEPIPQSEQKPKYRYVPKRPTSIYQYFSAYTKDEVDRALLKLSEFELTILRKKYGEDLVSGKTAPLDKQEARLLTSIRNKISNELSPKPVREKQTKKPKIVSIYDSYSEYSKDDILTALIQLTPQELEIVKKKFGNDYKSGVRGCLSKDESQYFYNSVAPKIKKFLSSLEQKNSTKGPKRNSIFEHFGGYSKEQIIDALQILTEEELKLVRKKFGEDYVSGQRGSLSKSERTYFSCNIEVKLLSHLSGKPFELKGTSKPVKVYSLFDTFKDYKEEDVLEALTVLTEEERKLLQKKYGTDYKSGRRGSITKSERNCIQRTILGKIRKKLNGEKVVSRPMPKQYKLYDYFPNYSKEAVDNALLILTAEDLEIVKKKFGNDFISGKSGTLTREESRRFTRTIKPNLLSHLGGKPKKMSDGKNSLFRNFIDYKEEDVLQALTILTEEERELLKKKYGNDYKSGQRGTLTRHENYQVYRLIFPKIRKQLTGEETVTSVNQKKYSIYEYYHQYTKEEVDNALLILTEDELKIIKKKYGEDLVSGVAGSLNKSEQNKLTRGIRNKLKAKLTGTYQEKQPPKTKEKQPPPVYSLFEYFKEHSEEAILEVLKTLTEEELSLVKKKYGEDYKSGKKGSLTRDESNRFWNSIVPNIKRNLGVKKAPPSPEKLKRKRKKYSLYECFSDYSKEEIDATLSVLDSEELLILKKKYGEDLVSGERGALNKSEENKLFRRVKPKIRAKLEGTYPGQISGEKKVTSLTMAKLYSLYEYFSDYTEEAVNEALTILSSDEIEVLKRKYGEDYKSGRRGVIEKSDARRLYNHIQPKLKAKLSGLTPKTTSGKARRVYSLFEVFSDYTEDNVLSALTNLAEDELTLLRTKYGEDYKSGVRGGLDRDASVTVYNRIFPKIRQSLTNVELSMEVPTSNEEPSIEVPIPDEDDIFSVPITSTDAFTKEDYEAFRDYVNRDEFKDAVKSLGFEESVLAILMLFKINGKNIPLPAVAELYGMEEVELREIVKKGLFTIKDTFDSKVDEIGYEYVKRWSEVV